MRGRGRDGGRRIKVAICTKPFLWTLSVDFTTTWNTGNGINRINRTTPTFRCPVSRSYSS